MKKFILIVGIFFCVSSIFAEGAKYLIITHDDFYNAIRPLAQWKQKKGLETKIVKLSETGHTSDSIKAYIKNAYDNWNPRPEYALLVGSGARLPCWFIGDWCSDDPYAEMTGDTLIDLSIGRLPCYTVDECNTMVAKVFNYERTPFLSDSNWFRKGTGIVREDGDQSDTIYWENVRYIYNLWQMAGYTHIDSFSSFRNNTASDVENAITDGRAFVVYRGQAMRHWYPPFIINLNNINNGFKLPIVISGSCITIQLASQSQSGFLGNDFLTAGSIQNIKGAAGYFGTTISGEGQDYCICRGIVTKGFYRSVLTDNVYKLGDATKRAKFILDSLNPSGYNEYRYIEWNLLGDPELNLWTKVPKTLTVTHPAIIQPIPDSQTFTITVKDSISDTAVSNALVCLMMLNDTNFYYYGLTNNSGIITFNVYTTHPSDSIWVTVTKQNYRPYEDKCLVAFVASSEATYPNQGRHLVHKPNTSELHMVYEDSAKIYYSKSTNWGQRWSAPESIDTGHFPCISIGPYQGSPWILYYKGGTYKCAVKRPSGSWAKVELINGPAQPQNGKSIGPSMVHALHFGEDQYQSPIDLAYGVFTDYNKVYFAAFDTINVYYMESLYTANSVMAPSISITPGDYIHVVWQRHSHDGDSDLVYYSTAESARADKARNGTFPTWSTPYQVSQPDNPITEPASNPFTEVYGDSVYVVWRGPNADGDSRLGDIWQRVRWMENDNNDWYEPTNISQTRDNESNYPVMSTDFVTVWHEQVDSTNWDIWGKFKAENDAQSFFQTNKSSKYPHIAGYAVPNIDQFKCYTAWTEEVNDSVYEVKFGCKQYVPSKSLYDFAYYKVGVGDSIPSPYCTHRDGYYRYEPYAIDYSNNKLKYRLPYLNPLYYYDLQAITYRTGQNNWTQELWTDSTFTGTIITRPNKPETLVIRIPQKLYQHDTKIKQDFKKTVGNWAVIADLKLYQKEEIQNSKNNNGIQSTNSADLTRPLLYQSFPNPFKSRTTIRYSLPVKSKVTLTIYDVSGRAVRTLVNENKEAGFYTTAWDGNDDKDRSLAQGVYFYRINTDNFHDTKRIILIR